MAEDRGTKVKTLRTTDDNWDQFREIADKFGNQDQAIAKLVELFKLEEAKKSIGARSKDIEQVQQYVNLLMNSYIHLLEENINKEEAVEADFHLLLQSKDQTIQGLQDKVKKLSEERDQAFAIKDIYHKENTTLSDKISSLEAELMESSTQFANTLADKENLNKTLQDTNSYLKEKNASLIEAAQASAERKTENDELRNLLTEAEKRLTSADNKVSILEKQLLDKEQEWKETCASAFEEAKKEAEFVREKSLFDQARQHNEEIQKIKLQSQKEVETYQAKMLEMIERFRSGEKR